jgi:hypothetical protein
MSCRYLEEKTPILRAKGPYSTAWCWMATKCHADISKKTPISLAKRPCSTAWCWMSTECHTNISKKKKTPISQAKRPHYTAWCWMVTNISKKLANMSNISVWFCRLEERQIASLHDIYKYTAANSPNIIWWYDQSFISLLTCILILSNFDNDIDSINSHDRSHIRWWTDPSLV